jgi:glycosyltransferase involved in cell wall biosynthesis
MIFIVSSGLGNIRRGMETHAHDLFFNLKKEGDYEVKLMKGGGKTDENEIKILNFPIFSTLNRLLSYFTGKNPLHIQSLTFALGLIPFLLTIKPSIIYLGEPFLYHYLVKIRKYFKLRYRIIFYTGGQTVPGDFEAIDTIQYVTPFINNKQIDTKTTKQHYLIPHFVSVTSTEVLISAEEQYRLRKKYNIPEKGKVILSVGSIDDSVKRMKYLIEECSGLGSDLFLIIAGEKSDETSGIIEFAQNKLPYRYLITSVSRTEVANFYQLADIFVLCSLREGFGLVYLEALWFGLPVIAHDFEVAKYVMKNFAFYENLEISGNLVKKIQALMLLPESSQLKYERRRFVDTQYSWEVLKNDYLKMFEEVKNNQHPLDLHI